MWLSCLKLWLLIFGALKFHAIYKNCPLFSSQCTKFIQNLYMDKTVNLKEKIHLYTAFDRFYSLLLLKIMEKVCRVMRASTICGPGGVARCNNAHQSRRGRQ